MEVQVQREAQRFTVSSGVLGALGAMSLLALIVFAGVAIHELSYASRIAMGRRR
jgi:hypothetical protein